MFDSNFFYMKLLGRTSPSLNRITALIQQLEMNLLIRYPNFV